LTIKFAPLEIPRPQAKSSFLWPLSSLFTRRYLIVKDLSGYTGDEKLIPELFVSGTTDRTEDTCAIVYRHIRPFRGIKFKDRRSRQKYRRPILKLADPDFP